MSPLKKSCLLAVSCIALGYGSAQAKDRMDTVIVTAPGQVRTADELISNVRDLMVGDEGAVLALLPSLWPVMKYAEKWKKLMRAWENIKSFFQREIDIRQERIDTCKGIHL